jgi:formate-dependent nitrite reductase cytochrome c552 subunit
MTASHVCMCVCCRRCSDPNARNNDGCTPIFYACEMCHMPVVQWLVQEGGAFILKKCVV